jgi:hypothetical protein
MEPADAGGRCNDINHEELPLSFETDVLMRIEQQQTANESRSFAQPSSL